VAGRGGGGVRYKVFFAKRLSHPTPDEDDGQGILDIGDWVVDGSSLSYWQAFSHKIEQVFYLYYTTFSSALQQNYG